MGWFELAFGLKSAIYRGKKIKALHFNFSRLFFFFVIGCFYSRRNYCPSISATKIVFNRKLVIK